MGSEGAYHCSSTTASLAADKHRSEAVETLFAQDISLATISHETETTLCPRTCNVRTHVAQGDHSGITTYIQLQGNI